MAWKDFVDPVTGDILLATYRIPAGVWDAVYGFVRDAGHVDDPFEKGDSCWKMALYLGICACESGFQNVEGDPAACSTCGTAWTCCQYYACLTDIVCAPGVTAWDRARAHAPYGSEGAYLSHGWYQLYVCGQGAAYVCDPARLHELALHMSIALPHIANAINAYWNDSNVEQSCRTCAQASGHPGWVGDSDYRVTNIWNATRAIQPDLYTFLLGSPQPPPPIKVTLYEHTGYGGASIVFTSDHPDFNKLPLPGKPSWNDQASSIKIEASSGTPSVRLYEHTFYQGASILFTGNHPNFNDLPLPGKPSWNDQASSIKVSAPPDMPPSPLPPIPVPAQTLGPSPLPPIPASDGPGRNPLPPLPQ